MEFEAFNPACLLFSLTPGQCGLLTPPRRANRAKSNLKSRGRSTLRLGKDDELKIQMQSRVEAARLARLQDQDVNRATLLGNFYQKVGFGSHHREKKLRTADVQQQIEAYVENLCQIYSKGTGGRADSVIEDRFVIYPDSSFRVYWDMMMLVFIVWSGFYVPFMLSFGDIAGSSTFLESFGLLTDLSFIGEARRGGDWRVRAHLFFSVVLLCHCCSLSLRSRCSF